MIGCCFGLIVCFFCVVVCGVYIVVLRCLRSCLLIVFCLLWYCGFAVVFCVRCDGFVGGCLVLGLWVCWFTCDLRCDVGRVFDLLWFGLGLIYCVFCVVCGGSLVCCCFMCFVLLLVWVLRFDCDFCRFSAVASFGCALRWCCLLLVVCATWLCFVSISLVEFVGLWFAEHGLAWLIVLFLYDVISSGVLMDSYYLFASA